MTKGIRLFDFRKLLLEELQHFALWVAAFGFRGVDEDVFDAEFVHFFDQVAAEIGVVDALAGAGVGGQGAVRFAIDHVEGRIVWRGF